MIRLFFCGADADWESVAPSETRRRHLVFLQSLLADPGTDHACVVRFASRSEFLRRLGSRLPGSHPKADSVLVAQWLPERPWLPWTRDFNRILARWIFHRQVGRSSATAVWCYALRGIAVADYLALEGPWLIDCDHDILKDPNRLTGTYRATEDLILRCARRARRVFSASRGFLQWLREHGVRHGARLRNGVHPERFEPLPAGRPIRATPVVGYLGVLSPWLDLPFLLGLARRRPGWRFVIAGPWYRMRPSRELLRLDNVELKGHVAARDVPDLLRNFDVALGLYRREPWADVDSMKIHEYLAAGLPTVSTAFHPHLRQDFEGLVAIVEDVAACEAKIEEILGWSAQDLRRWQSRCLEFAARNTWNHRTREAITALKAEMATPPRGASGSAGGQTARRRRPRLLLLADRPSWAFDYVARSLRLRLSHGFDVRVRYSAHRPRLDRLAYDLIHVFFWADPWPRRFDLPPPRVIVEVASYRWRDEPYRLDEEQLAARFLAHCETATTPSAALRDVIRPHFPRIFLTPNGFEPSIFHCGAPPSGRLKIAWVGRPEDPCKGLHEILLPACQGHFDLISTDGSWPRRRVAELYRSSDVLAVASTAESQPLPLIEGMASGCFPVSTKVGIAPRLIDHGQNGLLVDRSVEAFQDAFHWCEAHLDQLRAHRLRSAERLLQNRSWETCATYYEAVYRHVLERIADPATAVAAPPALDLVAEALDPWIETGLPRCRRHRSSASIYWRLSDLWTDLRRLGSIARRLGFSEFARRRLFSPRWYRHSLRAFLRHLQ